METNSSIVVGMTPWLHFSGGDNLYFKSLRPSSKGAIAGACIALICLALVERLVAASRSVMEARWRHRAFALAAASGRGSAGGISQSRDKDGNGSIQSSQQPPSPPLNSRRLIAPFILSHDIPRGAIHALQALLSYALMLAVMTFQAAYIISIILGLGIGEVLFGRMAGITPHAPH